MYTKNLLKYAVLRVGFQCFDYCPVLTDLSFFSTWLKTGYQVPVK